MDVDEEALLVRIAEFALRELRKEGCGRESLKKMIDRICNEVPQGQGKSK